MNLTNAMNIYSLRRLNDQMKEKKQQKKTTRTNSIPNYTRKKKCVKKFGCILKFGEKLKVFVVKAYMARNKIRLFLIRFYKFLNGSECLFFLFLFYRNDNDVILTTVDDLVWFRCQIFN